MLYDTEERLLNVVDMSLPIRDSSKQAMTQRCPLYVYFHFRHRYPTLFPRSGINCAIAVTP
jgi:hypothetical protein